MVLRDVTKYYGDTLVIEAANASIQSGDHIGFVGPNGIGKTTLLRIMAGREPWDSGHVDMPGQYRLGFLDQEVPDIAVSLYAYLEEAFTDLIQTGRQMKAAEESLSLPEVYEDEEALAKAMERYAKLQQMFEDGGGYEYQVRIKSVVQGLGFTDDELERPLNSFSGGERMRAQLARLLLLEPDLLLLDEPTNHLDVEASEWLEQYLQAYPRAVVVVSHDRYFLDVVARRIWELDGCRLYQYKGNYSQFMPQREQRILQQQEQREKQEAEMQRIEQFIRKFGAGTRARQAKSLGKRLARMEPLTDASTGTPAAMKFMFRPRKTSGKRVAYLENLAFQYEDGSEPVLTGVQEEITRGERIGLVGANGSGKTTLLRVLAGQLQAQGQLRWGTGVEVGYLSQTFHFTSGYTVLEELYNNFDLTLGELRSVLARFLFRGEDVFKTTDVLSGGEKNRLALAKLLLSAPNVLLLDEPTNHLDIYARAALEQALLDFGGTIVFVSHDRYFVDRLSTRLWVMDGGLVRSYAGSYTEYRQEVRQAELAAKKQLEQSRKRVQRVQNTRRRSADQQESVEESIEALELEKQRLEKELASPHLYQQEEKSRMTVSRYRRVQEQLEELYSQWELFWE